MLITLYDFLVFVHILLFVFWLGADMGVAVLGHHFRKRSYSMSERLTILKLLGTIDMFPRSAWALMVPLSLSLLTVGGYWTLTTEVVLLIWLLGFGWLLLVWQIHLKPKNPSISQLKKIEFVLKLLLASFYTLLGLISLYWNDPLSEYWLATKSLLFGFIFWSAIMIDLRFRDLSPALVKLVEQGSTDETEAETLKIMNRSRFWVRVVYVLLVMTAFVGTTKFY